MSQIISSTISEDTTGMNDAFGWFDVSAEDRTRVSALEPLVRDNIDEIINDFYERAGGFDHSASKIQDKNSLELIKEEQKRHFLELVDAGLGEDYFQTRKNAGIFNERFGVSPSFYMGAYSYFYDRICDIVKREAKNKDEAIEIFLSLHRIAACHKSLTIEAFAKAREQTIEDREREISELPVPVLKMREGLLLVPVVGTLDSHRARLLTSRMLDEISKVGARAVVLDITGVPAVDSAVANHLIQSMGAARLMGAHSVLTGISSDVAQSLVKLGVTGETLNPAGDLQRGIETAEALLDG
ncbi:protoglobin domain-containing protein [Tritonibacter mobilis]|nr:protoglobin domain-containing protein [Tritonibacter mobilis]